MSKEKIYNGDCPRARSHIVDSRFYSGSYATGEARQIFCDKYRYQRWLEIEATLAETQAGQGIIPQKAAEEISKNAHLMYLGLHSIQEGIKKTNHSLMPLLWALQKICKGDAGEYIHYGATTQDIQDTGQVLEIRDAVEIMERDLRVIIRLLIGLVEKYKDMVTIGRTHCQHALPMTMGLKFSVWADEVYRNLQRLLDCKGRVLVSQLFGGVGSMDALSDKALDTLKIFSEKLDLSPPLVAWHASRDRFAEFLYTLAILTGSMAKIANEIRCLARSETGEFEEPFHMGKIGSSTMPHKRNPEMCEQVVVLARLVKANAALGLEGIVNEHERDYRSVRMEWVTITDSCLFSCGVLHLMKDVLQGMIVHENHIERNLKKAAGMLGTEALMFALGDKIGKQSAHKILYEASMDAIEHEKPLEEILAKHPVISKNVSAEEIKKALDPSRHVGRSHQLADGVIDMVEEKLGKKHDPRDSKVRMCPLMNDDGGCVVPQIV
jgi:adenylosuccinate lyase